METRMRLYEPITSTRNLDNSIEVVPFYIYVKISIKLHKPPNL